MNDSLCGASAPSFWDRLKLAFERITGIFRKKPIGNTVRHALREFKAIGYKPISECEDGPDKWMQENVLELLTTFSKQGHSGFSASHCIETFRLLAGFNPLCPLTGEDDEWNDVSEYGSRDGGNVYQNNRCSHVFKEDGKAYDIDAVVYREPSGAGFTKGGARHYIEFPYAPTRTTIMVDFEGNEVDEIKFAQLQMQYEQEQDSQQ